MPEGFNSIADLRVVVDANADKFHTGLQGVRSALSSMRDESNTNLGAVDGWMDKLGNTVVLAKGKIGLLLASLQLAASQYQQFAAEGRKYAESLGVTTEYDRLTGTINDLGMSIKDTTVEGFFALSAAATATSNEIVGFTGAIEVADASSGSFAGTLLNRVSDALDEVRLKLKLFTADTATNANDLGTTVELVDKKIVELRTRIADIESGAAERFTVSARTLGATRVDLLVEATKELNALEERRNEIIARRAALPGVDWADGTKVLTSVLNEQIMTLEEQNAVLGMSAGAAAEYLAYQRAIADAIAKGMPLTAEQLDYFRQQAAEIGRLTALKDQFTRAEREAEAERQKALQADRARDQAFVGADRELMTLRQRERALSMNADAAARLAFEERILAQLRQAGGPISDADVVKARALAEEYGHMAERIRSAQDEMEQFGQFGQAISQGLGNAFAQWTRGAEMSVESMVANMIAQLAQLAFQASVLEPLFGGGMGGNRGLVGDFMSSLFGGFRENGGPVEAGKAYIVGEKRPELFIPNTSGRIEPSVGGAGPVQVVTNIDARGATPDAVQELRRMMAERDAALPNQVLAVVREGRERGVA